MAVVLAVCASAYDETALLGLARAAVVAEVAGQSPPKSESKSPVKPVFVTIENKGCVIGCRGSIETRTRSLEQEVILTARAAASHDPRYRPLSLKDARECQVTVTIVEHLDPLADISRLAPADGLVLRSGRRTGVVLPWEGKEPRVRLQWAYKKAGVKPGAACHLYTLKAQRFRG